MNQTRCRLPTCLLSLFLSFSAGTILPVPATAGLQELWRAPVPGAGFPVPLAISHITNTFTLQDLFYVDSSTLGVLDLNSGQLVATWSTTDWPGYLVPLAQNGTATSRWLFDVNSDGREEVIVQSSCQNDARLSAIYCLHYDSATQTLAPGNPPNGLPRFSWKG